MSDVKARYYEVIKRTSDTLYVMLSGEKKTHSELISQAEMILKIVLRNPNAQDLPEYSEILNSVVDLYEVEVGIKTYAPNVIAKDKESKYWLYKVKPTIPHSYFDRYKLFLSKEGYKQKAIENIEKTCEQILAYCANPRTASSTDKKKGLVVGDVQSGKTANYLGLINMAYDYGYKIVVLLAGTTNSLRLQTQKRADKGVIGAKSDSIGNAIEYIGVGLDPREHYAVPFTNQSNDFAKFIQKNLNAAIGDFNKPVVLVVKKIKSILESVSERLQSELSEQGLDSKSILIIDDEADNASPNTAKPENNPTTINRCIRAIFNKFPVASYVGYTATPFANVFIDPTDEDDGNMDLFPSDFIVQLNAPDIYFGGRKVFPKEDYTPRCLRILKEEERDFLPVIHDKYIFYPALAESLKEAIHAFLINNVIRTIRGHQNKHRSMMINITRYNDVQTQIWERVSDYIEKLTNEIEQLSSGTTEQFIANKDMKAIYDHFTANKFYDQLRSGVGDYDYPPVSWEEIQAGLYDEIKQFKIVIINSRNGKMNQIGDDGRKKRFDYEEYEEVGARVIAIGGMVLSRGLTLEGLMTSYYSRNAATYDTLLQMCRWFGYRPGYEDLCRVYLTQENVDRFDAVLDAVEDLKLQFAEMDRQGKIPKDFGLMIKESPDTLETTMLITARNKMRGTETIEYRLNYGGVYADTSKLSRKTKDNEQNYDAIKAFMSKVRFSWQPSVGTDRYMATDVSKFDVAELFRKLNIPYVNKKFDCEGLAEYVENSAIFPYWDVVVATGKSTAIQNVFGVDNLIAVKRSFRINNAKDPYIRIGGSNNRVMEPGILNVGLGLDEADKKIILAEKNNLYPHDPPYKELGATDYLKRRQTPILIIYPIDLEPEDKQSEEQKRIKDSFGEDMPLFAFAFGFPKKESEEKLRYRANLVKLQQLANIEVDDDEEGADEDDDN